MRYARTRSKIGKLKNESQPSWKVSVLKRFYIEVIAMSSSIVGSSIPGTYSGPPTSLQPFANAAVRAWAAQSSVYALLSAVQRLRSHILILYDFTSGSASVIYLRKLQLHCYFDRGHDVMPRTSAPHSACSSRLPLLESITKGSSAGVAAFHYCPLFFTTFLRCTFYCDVTIILRHVPTKATPARLHRRHCHPYIRVRRHLRRRAPSER